MQFFLSILVLVDVVKFSLELNVYFIDCFSWSEAPRGLQISNYINTVTCIRNRSHIALDYIPIVSQIKFFLMFGNGKILYMSFCFYSLKMPLKGIHLFIICVSFTAEWLRVACKAGCIWVGVLSSCVWGLQFVKIKGGLYTPGTRLIWRWLWEVTCYYYSHVIVYFSGIPDWFEIIRQTLPRLLMRRGRINSTMLLILQGFHSSISEQTPGFSNKACIASQLEGLSNKES